MINLVVRILIAACLLIGATFSCFAAWDGFLLRGRLERELGDAGAYSVLLHISLGIPLQLYALWRVIRRGTGSAADLRFGLCLIVATIGLYLILTPRSDGLGVELALAACASAFGALVAVRSWGSRAHPWLSPRWRIGGICVFQLCLASLLLEGGLRLFGVLFPNPLITPHDSSVIERIEAHACSPGQIRFGFPCNADGYYDEPFHPRQDRSKPVVAMIGDSFSIGVVPHRSHYTTVCERELKEVEIYNVGVGSCGPEEYRYLLWRDVLPMDPDAVVVSLFVGNDLRDLRLHTPGKRLRSWFDRGSCRVLLLGTRLTALAAERTRGGAKFTLGPGQLLTTEDELRGEFPWYTDPFADPGTFSPATFLAIVQTQVRNSCGTKEERIEILIDLVESMRDLSNRPFGIVLIPAEHQVEDALWERATSTIRRDDLDREEPQRSLRAGLKKVGIPYLDLLPEIRGVGPLSDGDRHCYRVRDTHFSVRGNEVSGKALAPFVRSLLGQQNN